MDAIAASVAAMAPRPIPLLTRLQRQQVDRWSFKSSSRFIEKRLSERSTTMPLPVVGTRNLRHRIIALPESQES